MLAAVEQLAAVREAVGEEVEMILDVHTRLEMPDSLRLCREVELANLADRQGHRTSVGARHHLCSGTGLTKGAAEVWDRLPTETSNVLVALKTLPARYASIRSSTKLQRGPSAIPEDPEKLPAPSGSCSSELRALRWCPSARAVASGAGRS